MQRGVELLAQLVEHLPQGIGQRALEFHPPPFDGVRQREARGVEKRPGEMRDRTQVSRHPPVDASVDWIADDRVADRAAPRRPAAGRMSDNGRFR